MSHYHCVVWIDHREAHVIQFNPDDAKNSLTYGTYDFASIMHYDRCAFSTACSVGGSCGCQSSQETMTALSAYNSAWNSVMGTANVQSYLDETTMRGLYPFSGDVWNDPAYAGATHSGTFQTPYNTTFTVAMGTVSTGGHLFIKSPGTLHGIGVYNRAVIVEAPAGPVICGN